MKYLLSTGESTNKIESYILDLFKVYLAINPDDIPHSSIGFNFTMTNIKKDDLANEVKSGLFELVNGLSDKFQGIKIKIDSLSLMDESTAKIILSINDTSQVYEVSTGLY
jgi:hypothetical protein